MLGNTVVWKPSSTAVYSNYFVAKILQEAGLPDGVINFVPWRVLLDGHVLTSEWLAGILFTGSTEVFETLWQQVAGNIGRYRTYPRLVGETGGKNFIFMPSVGRCGGARSRHHPRRLSYQGRKCSAALPGLRAPEPVFGAAEKTPERDFCN